MKTEQIGITKLKTLTYKDLKELDETILEIEEYKGRAVAVLIPMRMFLKMQYLIIKAAEEIE